MRDIEQRREREAAENRGLIDRIAADIWAKHGRPDGLDWATVEKYLAGLTPDRQPPRSNRPGRRLVASPAADPSATTRPAVQE